MNSSKARGARRVLSVAAAFAATALVITGCTATGGGGDSDEPVELTFWSWLPDIQKTVDLFEEAHPNITVKVENVGVGVDEYTKIQNAVDAGSGGPDVAHMTYDAVPAFALTGALADLTQTGGESIADTFLPGVVSLVQFGDAIYGVPQDFGPGVMYYREDLFTAAGVEVPTTWAEYADAAAALHTANPNAYITYLEPGLVDAPYMGLWQLGAKPWVIENGTDLTLDLQSDEALQWADYWTDLNNAGLTLESVQGSDEWFKQMGDGQIATWVVGAWGLQALTGVLPQNEGLWRVAPQPVWNEGDTGTSQWGGSASVVLAQSEKQEAATEFALWMNGLGRGRAVAARRPGSAPDHERGLGRTRRSSTRRSRTSAASRLARSSRSRHRTPSSAGAGPRSSPTSAASTRTPSDRRSRARPVSPKASRPGRTGSPSTRKSRASRSPSSNRRAPLAGDAALRRARHPHPSFNLSPQGRHTMPRITLPSGFQFGVATSAYQIEGAWDADGKGPSIWDTFSQTPGRVDGDVPGDRGVDHYRRYREDVAIMRDLGLDSYRFSLSWARLLPEGTGRINRAGIDFYSRLIDELLAAGIDPNVTLYHWDLPQALEDRGGWANRDVADWFGEYAALAFAEFGDRVPRWATLNEPIALWVGYGMGVFAPGRADERDGRAAMHNALLAHGRGVQEFRASGASGEIGIVLDIWQRHPATDSPQDRAIAERDEDDGFRFFLDPLLGGGYSDRLTSRLTAEGTMPEVRDGDLELIATPIDYLGLNVYSRVVVSAENYNPKWWVADDSHPGGNFLDNGMEFYPKSVYDAIGMVRSEYGFEGPIFITENGVSDGRTVADPCMTRSGSRTSRASSSGSPARSTKVRMCGATTCGR